MSVNQESLRAEAEKEADPRIDLAVERTELALERTQLAWMRTVLGFLGGGIALDKGIEVIHEARIARGDALIENAHFIGLILSISGTVLMLLTTVYYFQRSRKLAMIKGSKQSILQPCIFASVIILLLGMAISFLLWVT